MLALCIDSMSSVQILYLWLQEDTQWYKLASSYTH